MKNLYEKFFYTNWYLEDLEWFKNDLIFFSHLKKPEVKEMYKRHIEWELAQLKTLKDKLKSYD